MPPCRTLLTGRVRRSKLARVPILEAAPAPVAAEVAGLGAQVALDGDRRVRRPRRAVGRALLREALLGGLGQVLADVGQHRAQVVQARAQALQGFAQCTIVDVDGDHGQPLR